MRGVFLFYSHIRAAPVAVLGILFTFVWLFPFVCSAWTVSDSRNLVEKMRNAYAAVSDYQARLVIVGFGQDKAFRGTQRLLYTFKKPDKIRIEFENPHQGMVIVYPDENGEVVVRLKPWVRFFTLHLHPNNSFLEISPGQFIPQTDLGVLIKNINHSLTDMSLANPQVTADDRHVIVRVLSDNPFQRGIPTRYEFFIDYSLWLPVSVRESSPDGVLRRTVDYRDLRLNTGVADSFFELD